MRPSSKGFFAASVAMSVPHPLTFLTNAATSKAQLRKSWYIGFFQAGKLADSVVTRRHGAFIETLWRAWSPGFEPPRDHLMKVRNCIVRSAPRPLDFYREAARSVAKSRRLYAELADPANRSSVPLLYLHGGGDGCIGPEIARGQERHFLGVLEQEVLPGAGHFLHLEQPELVSRRVVEVLERQSEQSSAA
jgi:pimeloyl-ACP methyl ester carboxylesterase